MASEKAWRKKGKRKEVAWTETFLEPLVILDEERLDLKPMRKKGSVINRARRRYILGCEDEAIDET